MSTARSGARTRLASGVVHQGLRDRILGGELAPGDAIPAERALAEHFGVNRHAVREALKRLQQAGLISISQGGATRVRDWRTTAGLEVLLDLVERGAGPPAELMRSVLELRASIGVDAARRCAERASGEQREEVAGHAAAAASAVSAGGQPEVAVDAYVELWQRIIDGSGNLAYRLGLNSLMKALEAEPGLIERLTPGDPAALRALGDAIGAGDRDAAADAARRLLEPDINLVG